MFFVLALPKIDTIHETPSVPAQIGHPERYFVRMEELNVVWSDNLQKAQMFKLSFRGDKLVTEPPLPKFGHNHGNMLVIRAIDLHI